MKIYGYAKANQNELLELSEVTISSNPETLRTIASFINKMAQEVEEKGTEFEHEHFQNYIEDLNQESPDIIVHSNAI